MSSHRWGFQLRNGKLAYDDKDRTSPALFVTKRAALEWDEWSGLAASGDAVLVKIQPEYHVVKLYGR